MSFHVRVKIHDIEIDYEGPEESFEKTLTAITALPILKETPAPQKPHQQQPPGGAQLKGTTATLAAKLGGSSGRELAIAAAAHLVFVKGQEVFPRAALRAEMRSAKSYYKQSYGANFVKIIARLVADEKFNEPQAEQLALTPEFAEELRQRLG